RHIPVTVLSAEEAHRLLTGRLGDSRTTAEHEAMRTLAQLCGGLPLALSIIAGQADINPRLSVSALVTELRTSGLHALEDDDPAISLPSVLSLSYRTLPADQAAVFRLLGIAPGPDMGLPAAASLVGLAPGETSAILRGLCHASLLDEDEHGRYRMHDLVRLYAAERGRDAHDDVRASALRALIGFYLHTAFAAERVLAPHRQSIGNAPATGGPIPVVITDKAAAMEWFETEHPNLLAVQKTVLELGDTEAAWQFAWALDTYHFRQGLLHDTLTTWQRGVEAARRSGRIADLALTHRGVGQAHARLGDHATAAHHLGVALSLFRESDDLRGQADTLRALAWSEGEQGDARGGLEHLIQVQAVFGALDEPVMQADALNATGWFHARLGQYAEARARCSTALAQFRALGHKVGEADASASLGLIAHRTGRYAEAVTRYEAAITLFRELDDLYQVADPLEGLGDTRAALGEPDRARTAWQEAMRLYEAQGRDADAERVRGLLDRIDETRTT
ncbi:MAG: tetratricopeptide repeat protein, partial [Umezawaea sp.]